MLSSAAIAQCLTVKAIRYAKRVGISLDSIDARDAYELTVMSGSSTTAFDRRIVDAKETARRSLIVTIGSALGT